MDTGAPAGKAKSDINVTPLIDIVLVLLIVFIIMVPGLSKALPVVVPQVVQNAPPPPPGAKDERVVLEVVMKGEKEFQYMLQNNPIELTQIAEQLSPVVMLQPMGMRKIFLKVDEETPYQAVVNTLDQVRLASERAKKETAAGIGQGMDGGDVKVAIALRKKTA